LIKEAQQRGPLNFLALRTVLAVFDLSLQQLLIRGGVYLVIAGIHGFAFAGLARLMGDRGPQLDGRLTLNPFTHLDILGAITLIVAQMGWIRPITIDAAAMRFGRLGTVVCVVGSLAATLAAAFALLALRVPVLVFMPSAIVPTLVVMVNDAVKTSIWFVTLNLLPIPPLTGANFIVAACPGVAKALARMSLYTGLVVSALILLGVAEPILRPLHDALVLVLPAS
jgi:Zn-dependent protease